MPSKVPSGEELIARVRKEYLVGRFKVLLNQTENHPDQRGLDQSWVDELVSRIGDPEILNRALHPIGVILKDNSSTEQLRLVLTAHPNTVPNLPPSTSVCVFAGQHRLAMLAQLELDNDNDRWWHADVYKAELEQDHPAEFLTMMHESNTPQIMKSTGDVDLFRATIKLKSMLTSGAITPNIFLQNRRALLSFNDTTSRAICNLTRNSKLADAICAATSRPHIAAVFSAGSWKRLTMGQLHMVAAGLVEEMTAQVDLLIEGMNEVPEAVLSLQPRLCRLKSLETHLEQKSKRPHVWDVLPGGVAGALRRVKTPPPAFTNSLISRQANHWSLPDVESTEGVPDPAAILLRVGSGGGGAEDYARGCTTFKAASYEQYTSSSPATLEQETDHPEGMITSLLRDKHGGSEKVAAYGGKASAHCFATCTVYSFPVQIMQTTWAQRTELHQHLTAHEIPQVHSATLEDYNRLIGKSEAWWKVLRMFKIGRFPSVFRLEIPKTFGLQGEGSNQTQAGSSQHTVNPESQSTQGSKRQREAQGTTDLATSSKRSRGAQEDASAAGGASPSASVVQEESRPTEQAGITSGEQEAERPAMEDVTVAVDKEDIYEQSSEEDNDGNKDVAFSAPVDVIRGGDRRLEKVLDDVRSAADHMNRAESRALTQLLGHILEGQRQGELEDLVTVLVQKAKAVHKKLEQRTRTWYGDGSEGEDQHEDGVDGATQPQEREHEG
ncbi:hypothetical protein BDV93DRAFT_515410 [Ceratobasidium sp. AG-I]|nr:hypothetical protein BDV93DRAFT_515410 [Ceratobasidium sp. AG-I]